MLYAGLRVDTERHIAETCVANIERIKRAYSMRPKNRSSLSELFVSFLGKVFSTFTNNLNRSLSCF